MTAAEWSNRWRQLQAERDWLAEHHPECQWLIEFLSTQVAHAQHETWTAKMKELRAAKL